MGDSFRSLPGIVNGKASLNPDPTDQLGPLITSRGGSVGGWGVAFAALCVGVLLACAAVAVSTPRDWPVTLVLAGAAAAMLILSAILAFRLVRTFEFREAGVLVRRGSKVLRTMRYADCVRLRYELTRNYLNGFYTGTSLVITLIDSAKNGVKWNGRHKEKPKGLAVTVLGKTFKGEDELDVVKLIIADTIADRWVDRLLAGESIAWGAMSLTQTHVIPKKGMYKHRSIPHAEIDRLAADKGWFHLFHVGDEKAFFSMQMNAENFWPGMRVMERMWQANSSSASDNDLDSPESMSQNIPI